MSQAIVISPMQTDDTAFVAKALKEGLRHADVKPSNANEPQDPTLAQMSNWDAYRIVNPLVNDLLTKAEVLVARRNLRNLGFVVLQEVDGVALVWVYVRGPERKSGVAKLLFDAALGRISPEAALESFFPTPRWRELCQNYGVYTPVAL